MRRRIADAASATRRPGTASNRRGGLVDIEFIAQYLHAARGGAAAAGAAAATPPPRLAALGAAGALAAARPPRELSASARAAGAMSRALLKLTVEEPFDEAAAPPALAARCWRAAPARLTSPALEADMDAAAARALAHWYERLIAAPAARRADAIAASQPDRRGDERHEHRGRRQGPGFHAADRRRRQRSPCRSSRARRWCSISIPRTTPRAAPPRPAAFATRFPDYGKTGADGDRHLARTRSPRTTSSRRSTSCRSSSPPTARAR